MRMDFPLNASSKLAYFSCRQIFDGVAELVAKNLIHEKFRKRSSWSVVQRGKRPSPSLRTFRSFRVLPSSCRIPARGPIDTFHRTTSPRHFCDYLIVAPNSVSNFLHHPVHCQTAFGTRTHLAHNALL